MAGRQSQATKVITRIWETNPPCHSHMVPCAANLAPHMPPPRPTDTLCCSNGLPSCTQEAAAAKGQSTSD